MNNVVQQWEQCLEFIKANLPAEQFTVWFDPIVALSFNDNKLVLKVPSQFFVERIEEQYLYLLQKAIERYMGQGVKLIYKFNVAKNEQVQMADSGESSRLKSGPRLSSRKPLANPFDHEEYDDIDSQLNLRYTFENYCSGTSNLLPVTIGKAIADHPECKTYNPMFIFGSTGVGKTHLMQAIGIKLKENNPRMRVLYVTARVFESQYTTAVQKNQVNDFINFYQSIDVLLLDDIQEFAGKVGTQNTFYHIFNHLHQHGHQLIMSSDCRPCDMDGMVPRLISRFKWGMTVELEKPDYELRRNVLRRKAEQDGLQIGDDVVDFIASNVTDSIRDLEGIMVSLLANATVLNREISVDLARTVIGNAVKINKRAVTFELIAEKVAEHYHIDTELLYGKSRKREISDARQLLMYFAKNQTQLSSTNIGLRLSRNHATVLHACKQIEQRMAVEKPFRREVQQLEQSLR